MTDTRPSVHQFTLDNGLQVVWEEDHRQPLVAIEARIKGGLRGEGTYLGTGITHFIEHMLFKGTPSRPPGTIDQEVRRYGGTINAFTSYDTTGVSLFVESRHLKEALAMLADILQHAVFDQAEFDKERAVIISEIQMNLDDPDRRIHHLFWGRHFLTHPYRHPILGYQPLLEKLTVKDVTGFYAAQYQPQNVTIAVSGDFDAATFGGLAKELFGAWPRGTTDPLQLLVPAEPPTASAKEVTAELPVQTGYVMLGFSSTRLSDPDLYPLDVLANVLGDGQSSRLYETIVRKQQLAHAIAAWNYTPADPGIFAIQFQTDPERISEATAAVLAVLEGVKRDGISEAELEKAKRSVTADYWFGLQTVESKAGELANSMATTGDPLFARRYVEGIRGVTRAQVQDAARRYCDAARMTRAVIKPASPPAHDQVERPVGGAIAVSKSTLPNGATALIGEDHALPLAAIVVAFRGGIRVETDATEGLSNLVARMLTKGTTKRTAEEIARMVEGLGGELEPFSGRDGLGVSLQVLSQDFDAGLNLMHELVASSVFPERELAIQRQLISKQLLAQDDEIFDVGGRLLRRTLYGRHPYRFNPLGDRRTIGTLTRAQCQAFAQQWLVPSNMVVTVVGDVRREAVDKALARSFGSLPKHDAAWPQALPEDPLEGIQQNAQTVEKEQAVIMLGFRGSTHRSPDRYAVDVMTAVLSGMSGRLFQAVREQHGLSYTLGAVHVPGWDPGYLLVYAATRPAERDKVLGVLQDQLQLAAANGFSDAEVDQAKRYLIGIERLELQQLIGLAKRTSLDELYGLGYDAWTHYEDDINRVTTAAVREAAQRYLTMQQRAQVVVSPNGKAVHSP